MSILIVDDDISIRNMLRLFLSHNGYAVAEASNGAEALDMLRQTSRLPHLILLDLMMPVMNGVEFRDAQRQDGSLAHIPVALISAAENLQEKAPQLDADAYIPKPIDFPELLATVGRYCGDAQIQTG
jgi:CheY-like chemotaxis protein